MEEIEGQIDPEHILKRIADWKKRISNLYTNIALWVENSEYKVRQGPNLIMFEELMFEYNVPATEIQTIDILKGKIFVMSIKPKGLWIIGANGRIDLTSITKNVILVDVANQFEEPKWKLYENNKTNGVDLNSESFLKLLSKS